LQKFAMRAAVVEELADQARMASWYLALLGPIGLPLTALNIFVVRRSVTSPLSDIAKATDSITAGKTNQHHHSPCRTL
jgi:hypothetical protein